MRSLRTVRSRCRGVSQRVGASMVKRKLSTCLLSILTSCLERFERVERIKRDAGSMVLYRESKRPLKERFAKLRFCQDTLELPLD